MPPRTLVGLKVQRRIREESGGYSTCFHVALRVKTLGMKPGDLIRSLRERRGWSQTDLAERTNLPSFRRAYVAKIELGLNQLSTMEMREALARAFGLSLEELNAYLDGRLSLEEVARRGQEVEDDPLALLGHDVEVPQRAVPPPKAAPSNTDWGKALWAVARDAPEPTDFLAVQRAIPPTFNPRALGFDPALIAERMLRVAADLRGRSVSVTLESLLCGLAVQDGGSEKCVG